MISMNTNTNTESNSKIRLDKWLWAARFYKTRTLARTMIEGGKVEYNGVKAKPSTNVDTGATIRLLQGNERKEIIVKNLSSIRGPASIAVTLYEETAESIALREKQRAQQKLNAFFAPHPTDKPNKKERRQLMNIKYGNSNEN